MDTTLIENKGIQCFNNFLLKSKRNLIKNFISENDKTPLWDGNLILYEENHNGRKDKIIGQIPIQIKSTNQKKRKLEEKFQISKSDLNKYQINGGIIFIRPIFYNDNVDDYDIYIKSLLPVTIEEILRESNQRVNPKTGETFETISIELDKITEISHFETICYHFLSQNKLQHNKENYIDIDKVKKFFTDGASLRVDTIIKDNNLKDSLLNNNCYLYVITKDELIAPVIGRVHILNTEVKSDIKVNGEVFFNSIIQSQSKKEKFIKLNPNLILKFSKDNKIKIDLKQSNDDLFIDYYKALKFLNSINKHKSFTVDDNEISFTTINDYSDKIDNTIKYFDDFKKIIDMFRIDYSLLTFKNIEKEEKLIEFLIETLLYGAHAILKENDNEIIIQNYNFFDRRLFLLLRRIENEKYQVFDLLNPNPLNAANPIFSINDNNIPASRFLLLNKNSLISIDNFFDEVYQDIIKFYSNEIFNNIQNFMLACVHTYDETGKDGFINLAENLNEYFIKHTPMYKNEDLSKIHTINRLQISTRRRDLNTEEKKLLIELKNSKTDVKLLCCYLILLNYKNEFLLNFEKLSNEEQIQFKAWPIYTLLNKLNN